MTVMTVLAFTVRGLPHPQGSKKAIPIFKGKGDQKKFLHNNLVDNEPGLLRSWRQDVKETAEQAMRQAGAGFPIEGPVGLYLMFVFARPKSHYRTGRNAHLLKASASLYPDGHRQGDLDKLMRATMDALQAAGVFKDDCQVVHSDGLDKVWADHPLAGGWPGARVVVRSMPGKPQEQARRPVTAASGELEFGEIPTAGSAAPVT